MKAKKVEIETRPPAAEPAGPKRVRLSLPPRNRATRCWARVRRPRRPWSTCSNAWGCWRDDPGAGGDRCEWRRRGVARDDHVRPRSVGRGWWRADRRDHRGRPALRPRHPGRPAAAYGVRDVHHATGAAFDAYGGAAWASAVQSVRETAGAVVVTAAGTPRGMEVLAHLAARAGVAMAANVVSFGGLSPFSVTRQVVGGSVLEEMVLDGTRRCSPSPVTPWRQCRRPHRARPRWSSPNPPWRT